MNIASLGPAIELHLEVGKDCVGASLCLAAVYLTGGGGGLNGGGISILQRERWRQREREHNARQLANVYPGSMQI